MGRREELLRAEAEGWRELETVLIGLPDALLERPELNAEGWSVRDVMGHVAFWCSEAARVLTEIRAGTFDPSAEPEGAEQIDAINERALERSRAMSSTEARAAMHEARTAMLERFGELEAITADADEWFEESGPRHYADHLPELRAWLAARPG